jgi:phosphomannomutase
MAMRFNESVFKANDIRGVARLELSSQLARGVGRALADLLETPGTVAVGYDMRAASVEYAAALREGIIEQGRDVIDIGLVTSDMIYFAVGHGDLAGGAMVTASHNPGQYDGIKLCRRQAAPIGLETGLDEIEAAIRHDRYRSVSSVGHIHKQDITQAWITHALSFVDTATWPVYTVAIDAGNGMAGAILPHLESLVPLKITPLYWELDGSFPNHPASPIDPANLHDLIEQVTTIGLDLGIAFDGDGDRAFLVDDQGLPVSASVMTAIIAEATLRRHPHATILYNAVCSRIVAETIQAHGGRDVRTKVGHAAIKTRMRDLDADFAGEHSGHFYFKDNYYADSGLIAALVAIDILAQSKLTLSQLADKYRVYHDSDELNFTIKDSTAVIARVKAAFPDGRDNDLDGLTVNYPDWWFNLRPSDTEPLLRLNVEAKTGELLRTQVTKLEALVGEHPEP